jgi:hypothetical protein
MFKLPIRTWILNAAAVFSGRHGAVTRQAERGACSRETAYQHARKLERRLAEAADAAATLAELRAECQRLRQRIARLEPRAQPPLTIDKDTLRRFAATAFAMGVSLRQLEELLGTLLPAAEVPDHSTLGHWVQAEARRAGEVLEVLDGRCAAAVTTLAIDEIFFGGGRLWWASSRRA